MQVAQYKDYKTIDYVSIRERRPKAIKVDLFGSEGKPVWMPLQAIELHEEDFQIKGEADFLNLKIREAQGEKIKRKPPRMVKLVAPSWENERGTALGFDVKVYREGAKAFAEETRIFFRKSDTRDGYAPAYLVERKENEAIGQVNTSGKYDNSEFIVSGLQADEKKRKGSGGPGKPAPSRSYSR